MANPSWSSNNIAFTTLPGKYVLGGKPKSTMEETVTKKTDNGGRFVYLMYTRDTIDIKFIVNDTQLAIHRDFHDIVGGEQYPFYFSITGVGSADSVYVFKNAGFDPQEFTKGRVPTFSIEALYEISYHFETEIV